MLTLAQELTQERNGDAPPGRQRGLVDSIQQVEQRGKVARARVPGVIEPVRRGEPRVGKVQPASLDLRLGTPAERLDQFDAVVSVGRPLPGVELTLLDDEGREVPIGTPRAKIEKAVPRRLFVK